MSGGTTIASAINGISTRNVVQDAKNNPREKKKNSKDTEPENSEDPNKGEATSSPNNTNASVNSAFRSLGDQQNSLFGNLQSPGASGLGGGLGNLAAGLGASGGGGSSGSGSGGGGSGGGGSSRRNGSRDDGTGGEGGSIGKDPWGSTKNNSSKTKYQSFENEDKFKASLKSKFNGDEYKNKYILIKIGRDDCKPCQQFDEKFDQAVKHGKISDLVKINLDSSSGLGRQILGNSTTVPAFYQVEKKADGKFNFIKIDTTDNDNDPENIATKAKQGDKIEELTKEVAKKE